MATMTRIVALRAQLKALETELYGDTGAYATDLPVGTSVYYLHGKYRVVVTIVETSLYYPKVRNQEGKTYLLDYNRIEGLA